MPIPEYPLRKGDRGEAVAALHRSLEAIGRVIDPSDRDSQIFGAATEKVILDLQQGSGIPATGVFDADTQGVLIVILSDTGPLSVYGTVTDLDGVPVTDAPVIAMDVDLRRREELGRTTTDSGGGYEIRYTAVKFARAEKDSADIVVRVRLAGKKVVESPVRFNAPAELRVDITSSDRSGPSEFEELETALAPLLDGMTAADLTGDDVPFLAGETGWPADAWRHYFAATHLLAGGVPDGIGLAALYGWQRTGRPDTWDDLRAVRINELRTSLNDALDRNLIPRSLRSDVETILSLIPNADIAGLTSLLDSIEIPPAAAAVLAGRADALDAVTDELLASLVDSGELSDEHAGRIGLATSVQRLVDAEPAIVAAIIDAHIDAVPDGGLQRAGDLAALDPADWVPVLDAANAPIPAGVSREIQARDLAIAATSAFPEEALRARAPRIPDNLAQQVSPMRALLDIDKTALDKEFDALDLGGRADADELRAAHTQVAALVRTHPGLGLKDVFTDSADPAAIAVTRIGWVSTVLDRNPDTVFTDLDYLPDNPELTTVDFGDLDEDSRSMVLADLRANRRMVAVGGDAVTARELMVAGLSSGSAIARMSVSELAARTGLPIDDLHTIKSAAIPIANAAALSWFGIYETIRDRKTTPVRVIPSKDQYFYQLTGYPDLLTDQAWCDCADCQSVLGPAAYFVDLLHYVQTCILADSFLGQANHPLHLERRRPDLWELPLTCANSKDPVPTLDIVNELLERYIREVEPLPANTAVYQHLAEQDASLREPLTLPIERLDTLLGHFLLSRHDVARSMRSPRAAVARARLKLSMMAYRLITAERTEKAYLTRLFRFQSAIVDPDAALGPMELATLIRAAGAEHDALADAVTGLFVKAASPAVGSVTVTVGKRFPNDIQNNTEVVTGLSFRRLDRLHRFLRLWRTLPWTVAELDYVLSRLPGPGALPVILGDSNVAPGTLERITALLDLQDEWSIPLEQVLVIADTFPDRALRAPDALFDRLFNPVGTAVVWNERTAGRFAHPNWSSTGAPGAAQPDDGTLARLLTGLGLGDQDFVDLVAGIRSDPALDYVAATPQVSASISLDRASVTSLYRHARTRSLLHLSVADFVSLLILVPRSGSAPLNYLLDVDDVRALIDALTWQQQSEIAVPDLVYFTGGARPANAPGPDALLAELPAAVTATADPATRASIQAGLAPLTLFDFTIGALLGRDPAEIALLRECLAPPSATDLGAIGRVLDGGRAAADLVPMKALLAGVERLHGLFALPTFNRDGLTFLRQQRRSFFGADPAAGAGETLTLSAIRRIVAYRQLVTNADAGFTTAAKSPDVSAIRTVITAGAQATDDQVALALGVDEGQVTALTGHLTRSGEIFDDLNLIRENLCLAASLGVSGGTLARMVDESDPSTTYSQLDRAADDVLGAFRVRYPDPATLAEKLEPYQDLLRGRMRDAMVEHLTTRWPIPFADPDRLYDFFLIDVMVEGCARTSRVVSATSTVQLYVHRVLMNLERSQDWDPAPVGVFARFTDGDKRDEWEWRQYYRVWEANRKVFLYPENYLEPALRDDKTPLFGELEDGLLKRDLSLAAVTDAYSNYLTGFDGLAQLQIAGACRDALTHTMHLFGVTQDDAPIFYYRSIDESTVTKERSGPVYSAWHRIDLSIPVRRVSPIVLDGRLYLFWIETSTRPMNAFIGGNSQFGGYRHSVRVRFSTLRLDGTWAAPQLLRFAESDGVADSRIIEDPLDLTVVTQLEASIKQLADSRPVLQNEVQTMSIQRNQARDAVPPLTQARVDAYKNFTAALDVGQVIAVGLLIGGGVPPDQAVIIVKAVSRAIYQAALDKENTAREHLRNSEDLLSNAQTRVANLDARIAALEAAKASTVVHVRWDRSLRDHKESLDSYHPDGWVWDRVYPEAYTPLRPDLPAGTPIPSVLRVSMVPGGVWIPTHIPYPPVDLDAVVSELRTPLVTEQAVSVTGGFLNFEAGRVRALTLSDRRYPAQSTMLAAARLQTRGYVGGMDVGVAPADADVQVVFGQPASIIVQHSGDSVWLRPAGSGYLGMRLGTSLTRSLAGRFWNGGPNGLLAADFQASLTETRSRISPIAGQSDPKRRSPFHAEHPWLVYYRETFLHIPLLIADHLNTDQDFAGSQRWYHTIFDPTAVDGNVWRNRELADPDNERTSLRDLLVSKAALEAYRDDPFSPHAIARTRLSAYAKSIVMKYVDNLLDWGDSLYTQFTMEAVNEATMLYVMARDILGPRPDSVGPCDARDKPRTYREISKGLSEVSDFLVELETPGSATPVGGERKKRVIPGQSRKRTSPRISHRASPLPALGGLAVPALAAAPLLAAGIGGFDGTGGSGGFDNPGRPGGFDNNGGFSSPGAFSLDIGVVHSPIAAQQLSTSRSMWSATGGTTFGGGTAGPAVVGTGTPPPAPGAGLTDFVRGYGPGTVGIRGGSVLEPITQFANLGGALRFDLADTRTGAIDTIDRKGSRADHYHFHPVDLVPPKETVFCIPPNKELLGYWDRVDERLTNIRNCNDITGGQRQLSLLSPELDPRMLVRMTAAGLTIDDILGLNAGRQPGHHFSFLVEKAKQHLAPVQVFGTQLLAALERGDAQDLENMRTVHEQNLLTLRRKQVQLEIDSEENTLESLRRQQEAVQYRRDHFLALLETGTLPQEHKQQDLAHEASQFRSAASIAQTVASILTIIPDFGAATAMKFGGSQLGAAGRAVGEGLGAYAGYLDMGAVMAGLEGAVRRRDQEWQHQVETARRELAQLGRSITAAEIRRDIAVQALEVHERTITQTEEMFEFFRDRFTSAEQCRLLVKDLRRLYKSSFDSALQLARLAELAYRAERQDEADAVDGFLLGGYWNAQNAGLLAADRLLADLQRLERQYIERDTRKLEIRQSFSLAQFAPDELAALRLTGLCSFSIPEWFFDLTYPGQYQRRIKAVRLSIPCVTGPYTNIGATLSLTASRIRRTAPTGPDQPLGDLSPAPLSQTVSMATSRAQLDAGVFEFSFRDDMVLPGEYAGAISDWTLKLPRTVRMFDYATISDVVVHLDYTAQHSIELEHRWDAAAGLVLLLQDEAADPPPFVRRFSLRDDLPDVFHRLVSSPVGTEVEFRLDERYFSLFLAGRKLQARTASISLLSPLADLGNLSIAVAQHPVAPEVAKYITVPAVGRPIVGQGGGGIIEFDCGTVLRAAPENAGLAPEIIGRYLIKIVTPGNLGESATATRLNPAALRDIVIRFGYRLASTD